MQQLSKTNPVQSQNLSANASAVEEVQPEEPIYEAGLLTASEINDFQKWDLWKGISSDDLEMYQQYWKIYPQMRYIVQLTNEDIRPLVDANVELLLRGQVVWKAKTDNRGRAEMWLNIFKEETSAINDLKIVVKVEGQTISESNPVNWRKGVNFMTLEADCNPPNALDIAFVVDATGSMGDEIGFLKNDLMDVLEKAKGRHPDLDMRFGSLFYKCPDNDYITKKFDLTADFKKGIDFIKKQDAAGGGVESVEVALSEAVNDLQWRDEARARLLFLVLDESPGYSDSVVKNMHQAIQEAAAKGIHVIPVVASGMGYEKDRILEYLMRSTALATNGTCAFLTDDSGIGNDHTEPVTDEMVIEILGELMGRLIDQYVETPPCDQTEPATVDVTDTTWVLVEPIEHNSGPTFRYITGGRIVTDSSMSADSVAQADWSDYEGSVAQVDSSKSDGSVAQVDPSNPESTPGQPTESGFRFYPNPTSGPLTVEFKGDVKDIFITDPAGKIIQHLKSGDQHTINTNLSRFPAGSYFVRYIEEDRVRGARLVLIR